MIDMMSFDIRYEHLDFAQEIKTRNEGHAKYMLRRDHVRARLVLHKDRKLQAKRSKVTRYEEQKWVADARKLKPVLALV